MRCLDEEVILNVTNVVFFCCFFFFFKETGWSTKLPTNFLDVICSCPKPKQKPKNKHYSF